MPEYFTNYIAAATVGLVSIVIPMLIGRRETSQAYLMLALFLFFASAASALPILIQFVPNLELYSLAIVIPSFILQPVCIWFYVKGICSPTPWVITHNKFIHFVLPIFSCVYALAILFTPQQIIETIMQGQEPELVRSAEVLALVTFMFMLIWIIQSSGYIYLIIRRLVTYRRELKQLFASNDKLEMGWLFFIISGISIVWLLSFFSLVLSFSGKADNVLTNTLLVSHFFLLWLLSYWGLRQKPGFNERYIQEDDLNEVVTMAHTDHLPKKYYRSGLNEEHSQKIAEKVESIMKAESLFLNPQLSLKMLAFEIAEKPNYVSQALNQILSNSFFDYVNEHRIEYSKKLLLEKKLSILDVALESGFNAKSSFYKAFKAKTGLTPKQFAEK